MQIPTYFAKVQDFRVQGRCQHQLGDILGLILCGTLADCDDFSEIEDYGNDNIDFLKEELGFEFFNGIPSEDTMDRVLRYLASNEIEASFRACLQDISLAGEHLRIDGKELRGTIPSGKKHALVQMVNVWVDELGLSFGQYQVDAKSNEIVAIPKLLDAVDCQGSVVTIDAIGAQKAIVEKIRSKEADYVIALKANQGGLYEQVADFMEKQQRDLPVHKSIDKGHGRGEERNVYVAQDITLVDEAEQWKDLRSLAMVERVRHTKKGIQRKVQYYISSLEPTAEQMAHYVREHWAIENKLHWQLDFTFGEDDSRVRKNNGPANLHSVRKWALHLLKKDPQKISIKRKRKKAARSGEYLKQILTG
jgi:predicted transposase YbfD/YdcC